MSLVDPQLREKTSRKILRKIGWREKNLQQGNGVVRTLRYSVTHSRKWPMCRCTYIHTYVYTYIC
jgi:hypothetical protein